MVTQYLVSCNFMWMFCEGLYLHTLIVQAFTTGTQLLLSCYVVGWGLSCLPCLYLIITTTTTIISITMIIIVIVIVVVIIVVIALLIIVIF